MADIADVTADRMEVQEAADIKCRSNVARLREMTKQLR